ncbi:MAG: sensor histidine kinase [Spirochaetaceae bacterium]|jgi:signal transduction histidine kinase|nr:sensor histidine kinase [Spirochaetaceae bacterium]
MHYTLADMIGDLAQNAAESGASVIDVTVDESGGTLSFEIRDNGKGMDSQTLERAKDPFYTDGVKHPSRKVGLGIPFLIQTATETGGSWTLSSIKGQGTVVGGVFNTSNIDTPPVGDIPGLFRQMLSQTGSFEMTITRKRTGPNPADYRIVRSELADALGDLETVDSLSLLGHYLAGLEEPE